MPNTVILIGSDHAELTRKSNLHGRQELMTQKQERFMHTEQNFFLEKNRSHIPSSLDYKLIAMIRQ